MKLTQDLYATPLALLTDLYQLTMAQGYWKTGTTEQEAVFSMYFRKNPFQGGFAVHCGLAYLIDYLQDFRFQPSDLAYLATLKGNDGQPLLEPAFLEYLAQMEFSCTIDAIPEGTVVFPNEPLVRVRGPLFQCQLVESAILNIVNFQTLIATKAARICIAAKGEPVLEFGLRRAQGIDGGLAASRAAYIGGCVATSNVLAGKLFGIPVKGTHAHSWVMSFPDELSSFKAYAAAMPNNCVFLVDTYNTLEGVGNAISVGRELRQQGYEMSGIRLDSGDLAYLSIEARRMLDEAGFPKAAIVASNDLDEHIIASLKVQEARVNTWGVGTKLATAADQPALGGVYKLCALRNAETGEWEHKIKLSEQRHKVSNPGLQQVRRFTEQGKLVADMIWDELTPPSSEGPWRIVDPMDETRRKKLPAALPHEDLLVPIFEAGKLVYEQPDIRSVKARVQSQLRALDRSIKRFVNPHNYPVGLEQGLYRKKTDLIISLRESGQR